MKFFAYALLILGVAGTRLHSQSAALQTAQVNSFLAIQLKENLASRALSMLMDPEELEKEFEDKIMKAMEDDGKLSWPEAKDIIVEMLPKVIEYHLEEAKKHGATDEQIAEAKKWIEEHYDEIEAWVLKHVKKGFMECDTSGDKKLDMDELEACKEKHSK